MKKYPKVSIVIPLWVIEPRFFEDLKKFESLDYPNYEVLGMTDTKIEAPGKLVKVVLTGKKRTGPAEKRDIALKVAKGEIIAFIDDDAYPKPDWLKKAVRNFKDEKIAGVGGPGLTPPEEGFREQITGVVYSSY